MRNFCYHHSLLHLSLQEVEVLKRYQVLLPDWLEDYIKHAAEKYDMSFSEVIRGELCFAILNIVPRDYPEFKPGITAKEISDISLEYGKGKMDREIVLKVMSKIYFEARKAAEYRLSKEKKQKKE